ncbi:hypothetical protein [Paraburkholderia tropica]|uniref:hypothetical protein n=1 Tax=Paraburkholderia tropica TaxID=92647 RepID=UPI002AB64E3F|nr:hypothetical protein [Paraburkholderia tropica]
MDRLIAANSVPAAQADTAPTSGTPQYATDGNPASNIVATRWPSYQYNAIQEELIAILTAAGITPDRTNNAQIAAAIKALRGKTSVLADAGAVNAYAAVNSVPLTTTTWVDGVVQAVKIAHTNTGASTYSPDGLTAIPIYGLGLQPLQASELFAGGTAILMHATITGVNSGNPICVLMECAGGAQQISNGTQSQHAVTLGQLVAKGGNLVSSVGTVSTISASVSFTAPQKGVLFAWAQGNLGTTMSSSSITAAGSGFTTVTNLTNFTATGISVGTAEFTLAAGASLTLTFNIVAGTASNSNSAQITYLFVPTP